MLARKSQFIMGWHTIALDHLFIRHSITLDEPSEHEISHLLHILDLCKPTSFDHLEILRLFETALQRREDFMIGGRPFSTIELFFASMIVGLKLYNDINHIPFPALREELPNASVYACDKNALSLLESAFLTCINWKVQGSAQATSNLYMTLLEPLDAVFLHQIASSFLLTAGTDAVHDERLYPMFCQLIPNFEAKSRCVWETIESLPLKFSFIENANARNSIIHDIYDFLSSSHASFKLRQPTFKNIRYAVMNHFESMQRPIKESEFEKLAFYFIENEINKIYINHLIERVNDLESALEPINRRPYNTLIRKPRLKQIHPNWLSSLLNGLEKLNNDKSLTADMLLTIFNDYDQSHAILNCYLALHREGWLRIINARKALRGQVYALLFIHNYQLDKAISITDQTLREYFTKVKPRYEEITFLHRDEQTDIGRSLARDLSKMYFINLVNKQAAMLAIPESSLEPLGDNLIHYFKQHEKERLLILYALNSIKHMINHISASVYLSMIESPNTLRFQARLSLLLRRCLDKYGLQCIHLDIPNFYGQVIHRIMNDRVTLSEVLAFFDRCLIDRTDMAFTLNSILGVKIHLKFVIDDAIASGRLKLSEEKQDDLATLYRLHHMSTIDAFTKALPPCHLFSIKPASSDEQKHEHNRAVVMVVTG